jgi:hypothetical protein
MSACVKAGKNVLMLTIEDKAKSCNTLASALTGVESKTTSSHVDNKEEREANKSKRTASSSINDEGSSDGASELSA